MDGLLAQVALYSLLPVGAIVLGGTVATVRRPGPVLTSAVQHLAAGVVFAAVAGELIPAIMHNREPVAAVVGFTLGVAVMLGIKELAGDGDEITGVAPDNPASLLTAVGVDVAIDGFLVGVGFAAGSRQGVLVTVALTLEVLFLGLATAAALGQSGFGRRRVIATVGGLAAVLALGAGIGATVLGGLAGAPLAGGLAFGAAALLYLVTEELLVEAHEVPDTRRATAMFFLGFLVLLVIEMLA